jgi:hypothetical protein
MRLFTLACAAVVAASFPAHADDKSEAAAAELLHRRMRNENPEDLALLRAVHGKSVIVVAGSMDHIEQVLGAARIEHTVIQPAEVAGFPFKSSMIVMVNCPGVMPDEGVQRLQRFVRAGGLLYTTDWSLKNVIEKAFPGTIAHNGRGTSDEVVPVTVDQQSDNLMSNMLLRKASRPQWWLEGSSFPIRILDRKRVEVLAHSDEMRIRYGAAPVVVRFRWEDGEVIHVVSHFYRQVATHGPQVAAAKSVDNFEGLTSEDKRELAQKPAMAAPAGDVESSYAFQRMTTNLVTGKQKANKDLQRKYNMTVKGSASLLPAPSAGAGGSRPDSVAEETAGTSMRVLEQKGDMAKVRDEAGNEGWLPAEALIAK